MRPPAKTARHLALGLSIAAVLSSIACGFFARQAFARRATGLNVYVAPFLWELFAIRIDRCVEVVMRGHAVARGGG